MKRPGSNKRPAKSKDTESRPKRANRGRQQLRTITRTARRDVDAPVEETPETLESEAEEAAPEEKKFEQGKAYDALLTLLQSEHPEKSDKKKTASRHEEDDVAGVNLEEDNDDDEEEEEIEDDENEEIEDDNNEHGDPFEVHFGVDDEAVAAKAALLSARWPVAHKAKVGAYAVTTHASPGEKTAACEAPRAQTLGAPVKKRVADAFAARHPEPFSPLEQELAHHIFSYRDVLYASRTYDNTVHRKLYAAHVLNHVFKTRDRVLKNNDVLKNYHSAQQQGKATGPEPEPRDQGFTRPKVLILLPTRNAAYEVVEQLIGMSGAAQQENRRRFKAQFHADGGPPDLKPADFRAMFHGNLNDFFSIGLKFTRKSVKLYASFYGADILVALPIGLAMILEDPKQAKREYDFLSSIEVLVVDRANELEMQNWDHVHTVLRYINKIPKDFHGADFSRIRMWAINDHARLLRQTLVFCDFLTPSVSNVITHSQNIAGKTRFRPETTAQTCVMNSVGLRLKQIFQRFDAPDPQSSVDARFRFFVNSVLPSLSKQTSYDDGLLIYVPSYFDYVRLKAHMKTHTKLDFSAIDEYSLRAKITRARHFFLTGKTKLLLYTERLHHYRRFELAGVKNIVLYGPPENPLFYKELLRFVGKSVFKGDADTDLSFIKTIYCKWDAAALERICGAEKAAVLCNSVNEMFEFR